MPPSRQLGTCVPRQVNARYLPGQGSKQPVCPRIGRDGPVPVRNHPIYIKKTSTQAGADYSKAGPLVVQEDERRGQAKWPLAGHPAAPFAWAARGRFAGPSRTQLRVSGEAGIQGPSEDPSHQIDHEKHQNDHYEDCHQRHSALSVESPDLVTSIGRSWRLAVRPERVVQLGEPGRLTPAAELVRMRA
jgi:hypothetical protein